MDNHKFAQLPSEDQSQQTRWLRLIDNTSDDFAGVTVLLYEEGLSKSCTSDYWFETVEEALEFTRNQFTVTENHWQTHADLTAKGIEIIEEQ